MVTAVGSLSSCREDRYEKFEDIKVVIRIRKSTKDKQHNGQKKKGQKHKQRSTKHYTEIINPESRIPLKTGVIRKGQQFLRQTEHIRGHLWHRYSVTVNQVMVAFVKRSKW